MSSSIKPSLPKEYEQLLIQDFRKRVYPLALACAVIFAVFFIINASGYGKELFVIPDAIVSILFLVLSIAVKRGTVPPIVGSGFILSIVMAFFVAIIIYSGSIDGILFFYCVIPFFAFYMMGTKAGRIHGAIMLSTALLLWLGANQMWFEISYSSLEMGVLSFLLAFTIISAWAFESVREETFRNSYQQGVKHDALMQAIDEVYYRVGVDGIIQEIGEAIFTLTGFDPSEVEGNAITTFYANPDERDGYIKALQENGSVKNYPIEIVGKQNQHVMILMSSRIVFDEDGVPIYIEGMFRDITKERKLEEERKEHLELLSNLSMIETALAEQDFELSIQQSLEKMLAMFSADYVFLAPLCYKDITKLYL